MDELEVSLDTLQELEAEAFQALNEAYIQYSLARRNTQARLREIRDAQPTLFTE